MMTMEFDEVRRRLALEGPAFDVWRDGFAASEALAAGDEPALWNERAIRLRASRIGLAEPIQQALADVAPAFVEEPALRRLAWHAHHLYFSVPFKPIDSPAMLPMLPADRCGAAAADLFYAVALLSGVDKTLALHRFRSVPEPISTDTLLDLEIWMRDFHARHGRWGLAERWWPSTYFSGQLYKLGRLQFQMTRCALPFVIFQRRDDNGGQTLAALAEEGSRFRAADGQFHDADQQVDAAPWIARFVETGAVVRGHAVSESGAAVQKEPVELRPADDDWACIARRGDAVLDVHIPATGPLDEQAVERSFAQAGEFFPRHFPEFDYAGFTCISWLLDPQLRDCLPPTSNIVRFLDRFRLLPLPGADHRQTYERVFGDANADIERAAPTSPTHLQRAILAHVRAGGRWRMTGGFIPRPPAASSEI